MRDKKFQVFVSSTFTDLKEERQAAVEAILSSGNIPAGMELFSAGDESQMTVIKRWIDESDIYLLIFGGRYGSVDPHTGKSYTHLEYEYALEIGKPLFAVIINKSSLDEKIQKEGASVIEQENPHLLKEFKELVLKNLVKFWDDKKDIKLAIHETLSDFSYNKNLTGWIRGDNDVNTAFLAEEIARLTKENSELRELANTNVKNEPLYSNLTFDELKKLLENKIKSHEGNQVNLFDYVLNFGYTIANKDEVWGEEEEILRELSLLNVVRIFKRTPLSSRFEFTEDGHKFYLKGMVSQSEGINGSK